jgi:hypothetical protein
LISLIIHYCCLSYQLVGQVRPPIYGAIGQVADDEMVIALPPGELSRAVSGMKKLAKIGFRYPTRFIGGLADPTSVLAQFYPDRSKK